MTEAFVHGLIIGGGSGLVGLALGWFLRYRSWRNRKIVVPPATANAAPYEVRLDGRTIYHGWDLHAAKTTFKSQEHPKGILELYGHGNHISSRKN